MSLILSTIFILLLILSIVQLLKFLYEIYKDRRNIKKPIKGKVNITDTDFIKKDKV